MSLNKSKANRSGDLVTKDYLDEKLEYFVTKDYLDERLDDVKETVREETARVLQSVDKIVTKFDKAEKDHAADKLLHDRHERRLEKLEAKI